ncbi:MAG TPA: tRNA (adenosine(37)-N6)-threonylcarbamoyltransferase complex ATPase subunit type 1 TsaE [Limnochordales bacterium]
MGGAWALTAQGPEGTVSLGEALGARLEAGDVVALYGPPGAGKTTLVQGLARGLGAGERAVVSPTFVYVREVAGGRLPLYHVDLYRLAERREGAAALVEQLGLDWYFDAGGVVAVEWPEPIEAWLPPARFVVRLDFADGGRARRIRLEALGERPAGVLRALAASAGWEPVEGP